MDFEGRLSQPVTIYRRAGESSGGTTAERYIPIRTVGAAVRDDSEREHDEHEAAAIEHVVHFTLRRQEIPRDGLIGWNGGFYRIRHVDNGNYRGRKMRVSGYEVRPRATIRQSEVPQNGEIRV